MNILKAIFLFFTLFNPILTICAQFHTVRMDTSGYERISGKAGAAKVTALPDMVNSSKDEKTDIGVLEDGSEVLPDDGGHWVRAIENVVANDSLLLEYINERLLVSLPLDHITPTSRFGYRPDPMTRKRKFHDGVDLRCRYQYVYSMFPAKVVKTVRGNVGYGNFVMLDHGNIQCLYGHLSDITVKEGDTIDAGTVVGVSGSSGRSTGPHLHILLTRDGKSIDPLPFIRFLQDYICSLQESIIAIRHYGEEPKELTRENLVKVMKDVGVHHRSIVLAQAILETGNFTSRICREYHNLFGLYDSRKKDYYRFARWEDSVIGYKKYVQYKYRKGSYYDFLERIGYAEDERYVESVKDVEKDL